MWNFPLFENSAGSGNYGKISFSKHSMIALQYWNVWYECSQKRSHHFLRERKIEISKRKKTEQQQIPKCICVCLCVCELRLNLQKKKLSVNACAFGVKFLSLTVLYYFFFFVAVDGNVSDMVLFSVIRFEISSVDKVLFCWCFIVEHDFSISMTEPEFYLKVATQYLIGITIITRKNRPLKSASFFNLSIVRWSVLGAILPFFFSNAYTKSKQKRNKPTCIRLRQCHRSPEWMWNFRNIHSCMCYQLDVLSLQSHRFLHVRYISLAHLLNSVSIILSIESITVSIYRMSSVHLCSSLDVQLEKMMQIMRV